MSRHGLLPTPISTAAGTPMAAAGRKKRRCGEVMGGATAECTAVVCCCPFAVMDALVLALYKAPRGMCRKAIERKRKRNRRLLKQRESDEGVGGKKDGMEESVAVVVGGKEAAEDEEEDEAAAMAAVDLEMYDKFYGTGFWRSCSQRSSGGGGGGGL